MGKKRREGHAHTYLHANDQALSRANLMSTTSAKRARAAACNNTRDLVKCLDTDLYENVSPEMAEAFSTIDELGNAIICHCGNKNQKKWFVGCTQHLVCEIC